LLKIETISQDDKKERINKNAFEEWLLLKELKAHAIKLLDLLNMPVCMKTDDIKSINNECICQDIKFSEKSCFKCKVKYCIDIGKALKGVDRSLLHDWARWSKNLISFQEAITLWDFFPPRSCDVHSVSFSHVRIIRLYFI
jgi:hypothetical protein